MKRLKYKFIGALLLIVFSVNTVSAFACSMGIDMAINSTSQCNHHQEKNNHSGKVHHAQHSSGKQDNCCGGQMLKFDRLDKSVTHFSEISHPVFLNAILGSDCYTIVSCPVDVHKDIKQFVRSYHPPIGNIRIAIQSFQI